MELEYIKIFANTIQKNNNRYITMKSFALMAAVAANANAVFL